MPAFSHSCGLLSRYKFLNVITGLRLALRKHVAEAAANAIAANVKAPAVIGKMCFIVITPICFDFVRLAVHTRAVSAHAAVHHSFLRFCRPNAKPFSKDEFGFGCLFFHLIAFGLF